MTIPDMSLVLWDAWLNRTEQQNKQKRTHFVEWVLLACHKALVFNTKRESTLNSHTNTILQCVNKYMQYMGLTNLPKVFPNVGMFVFCNFYTKKTNIENLLDLRCFFLLKKAHTKSECSDCCVCCRRGQTKGLVWSSSWNSPFHRTLCGHISYICDELHQQVGVSSVVY